METQGKVAVVTGGASGIGRGMARAFAGAGMSVMLADLDQSMLDATAAELAANGTQVATRKTDVSKLEEIEALAQATIDRFGAVHVLCSNAGIGIPTPTHKLNLDDWRWMIDVDLWGPIYGVKVFLPIMEAQGEGHINATSSLAGLVAGGMMGAYNVAKHGVTALMTTLERDLRGRKSPVRASLLCPGPINTNISRHSVEYRPPKADAGQARPPRPADAEGSAPATRAGANIQSMLEQGMDPDEVGNLVLDAVQRDTFWILTHPRMAKLLTRQVDAMLDDGSLTKA